MEIEERNHLLSTWKPITEAFLKWLGDREHILEPGLSPEPTGKVLIFLALLDADKACTYDEIREIFYKRGVIEGNISDNTLRTSVSSLGKTLEKFNHRLELRSFRGRFQLKTRDQNSVLESSIDLRKKNVLLLDDPVIDPEEIARIFIEKSILPFNALYFLEWSARCWEVYSRYEVESRVQYETGAWEKLGIKQRLLRKSNDIPMAIISLGPSEGLAEIELIKNIFNSSTINIHYLAVDSSPRLLRNHIGLLKETFAAEIVEGRLLAAGIVDFFSNLHEAIKKVRTEFIRRGTIQSENDFLPTSSGVLVTYFGNCLGNDGDSTQDPEVSFFSMIRSVFQNRPLEILVGVSVMRSQPDEYQRNWGNFLLLAPKYLLTTAYLFESTRKDGSNELPEFMLPEKDHDDIRCPTIIPEPYFVRHQIKGQIYRFYYRLAFDLKLLKKKLEQKLTSLPKGSMILLHNIVKYDMKTLVMGIEKSGLFQVEYDPLYHQVVNTSNGKREYAVFSAYLEE